MGVIRSAVLSLPPGLRRGEVLVVLAAGPAIAIQVGLDAGRGFAPGRDIATVDAAVPGGHVWLLRVRLLRLLVVRLLLLLAKGGVVWRRRGPREVLAVLLRSRSEALSVVKVSELIGMGESIKGVLFGGKY